MTTLLEKEESCLVCGHTSEFVTITSTSSFGSPDLDFRPPDLARSTMRFWVQRCPRCGYCAPHVSNGSEQAREIVSSESYMRQLQDAGYPSPANSFLCCAIIRKRTGHYVEAARIALCAAWVCDDDAPSLAAGCRRRAIDLLRTAQEHGSVASEDTDGHEAILADLLRRTGQFVEAMALCNNRLRRGVPSPLRNLFRYQRELAARQDSACHTTGHAEEFIRTTTYGTLNRLVELNRGDGSWNLNKTLAAILGRSLSDLEAPIKELHGNGWQIRRAWATGLALNYLETHQGDHRDEWELLAAKADTWLQACGVQTPNGDAWRAAAARFLA